MEGCCSAEAEVRPVQEADCSEGCGLVAVFALPAVVVVGIHDYSKAGLSV